MRTFICLTALVGIAFSSPIHHVNVAEDTLGNYKFDFDLGDQKKFEERKEDGFTSGSYSYVDPDGVLHTVNYQGGEQGFIVNSPDVPVPVQDTVENIQAHNQHVAIFNNIQANPAFQESPADDLELPANPEEFLNAIRALLNVGPSNVFVDTPEIAQAKVDLLNAHHKALGY